MNITITPEITAAFNAYLEEPVDWDFGGAPVLRKNTYPYNQSFGTGMVSFAAGYQARDMRQPPQAERVPMTNGEIYTAYITATNQTLRAQDERLALGFARAIEAFHGIGVNHE